MAIGAQKNWNTLYFIGDLSKDLQIVVHGPMMHQQMSVTFIQLTLVVVNTKKEKNSHHGSLDITVLYAGLQEMNALVLYMIGMKKSIHNF